jgi:signal transduction histidine kinase/ABC-type uncharacterized transport system substrate-binding protein
VVLKRSTLLLRYFIFITIILILSFPSGLSVNAMEVKRNQVLILNSYSEGLSWTENENDGILSKLDKGGECCEIAVEYMDWKTYPTEENLSHLHTYLKFKYAEKKLDVVIATDDAALKFALDNRKELFNNAPVIFCGVNTRGVEDLTAGEKNVTGVVEEIDAEGTISNALKIYPGLKKIYVIFDNSESGISTWDITLTAAEKIAPGVSLIPLNKGSYNDILDQVGQADKDSIILITTYYGDEEGMAIGFENLAQVVSDNSHVPVFHLYDFGLGHGAIGGSMLSGKVQGELAGAIARRVLNGENISDIPVYTAKTTQYMFDYVQLERFNISSDHIPKGSIIINKPYSLLETYKNIIITTVIIIVILTIFIFILLVYLRKIQIIKEELASNNAELSQLYEELTASEEELRVQYDELSEVQKSLVSSEERYRQLFEKMMNGYFVFEPVYDKDGRLQDMRFVEVNPNFKIQTQMSISDLPGRTWSEVFGIKNRNQLIYQRVLDTGQTEQFETYYPDSKIYYLVNTFKINNNQVGVVFDNITNYKMAINEVRKLNEELEQRVRDRTRELQSAVSQLEAFTYTVSHDLKSPLRAVESYVRIVMEDYGKAINKDMAYMLSNVRNISRDMIDMINKLLQYSTTSRSELNIEEINTEAKFVSCFEELKAADYGRDIELIIETGLPNIMADRIMFGQVITNILSNSFKFTKDRKKAQIRVGSTLTENEYIFYVKDNGVGFDMAFSNKLFGIFQRLHTSDEFEGSGIGLVTVKKIIEKHGGKTWIQGEVGIGTTIYFTVPFEG